MIVYLFVQVCPLITSPTCSTVTVPPQLSLFVGAVISTAGTSPTHATVVLAGACMYGATLSFTVIVCDDVAVLLHTSVALYVLVIVYLFVQVCPLITSPTCSTVTVPPQLSLFVGAVISTAGTSPTHATVVLAGACMYGATLSFTVIVCDDVAVLLHTSVAL